MSSKVKRQARQISQQKGEIIQQTVSVERVGILPPPEEMEAYEKIQPGITKILLDSFVEQSQHRMQLEKATINSGISNSKRGQVFAFILSLSVIIGGFVLVFMDKNVIGISAILGALATLVGIFIYGNKSKKDERLKKSKENP